MLNSSEIGKHILAYIGPYSIHVDTLLLSWLVMAVLVVSAWLVTRRLDKLPHGVQSLLEALYEFLQNLMQENMSPKGYSAFPYLATLFLFILFANLLGVVAGLLLPQFKSPTGDLNVTMAMALVVFLLSQVYAVKTHGLKGYLVSFFKPNPLFLPLNLIELITRPLTLAFRLFGNIFAGEVLLVILYLLVPVVIPTVWSAFSVFIGVIQAYLFLMLGIAYISSSIEE
jgi:F-type H+-transporting ATPase subunit a